MAVNSVLAAQVGASSSGGGSGTVTSVALTAPSEISVAGSPVTTSGTIALTWATKTANTVFAGPTSGGAATPAFRALVAADIPSLSATYLPLAGGTVTGATTFSAAGTALAVTNNATVGGTLAVTGAVTGGTYNSQTISSAASFTGSVAIATTLSVTGASTQAAITASGALTVTVNGAASAPGITGNGTWYAAGSATTNKAYLLIEPTGTTSTGWSTAGTGIGVNAASGFTGNILDLQLNGTSKFKVANNGATTVSGLLTTQFGITATGAAVSLNASSNFAVNIGTGSTTSTVTVGGGSNAVVVAGTNWAVTSGGNLTANTITGTVSALTDGASIAVNLALGQSYTVTLGGNRTLANPTNVTAGQAWRVAFKQDGTGGRTISFGTNYDTTGFTALTGTANKIQEVYFYSVDATHIRVLSTNPAEFAN